METTLMDRTLAIAEAAARAGGRVLAERAGRLGAVRTKSSVVDMVTDVDIASGVAVVRSILAADPAARVIVEEPEVYGLTDATQGELRDAEVWVIDPLDGTTSYIHGYPCYSVSVACLREGRPVAGAVYNASRDEMTSGEDGRGATLDGVPIRAGSIATIPEALLITGFPYDRTVTLDHQLAIFSRMIRIVHGIRRDGSAAIDLSLVASGRADGFWELALKPWDMAAGIVILREAGAIVTDLAGEDWTCDTTDAVAANPVLHAEMLHLIAQATGKGGA
jgi:myo-inositol-1(or 4)-monophosphatase